MRCIEFTAQTIVSPASFRVFLSTTGLANQAYCRISAPGHYEVKNTAPMAEQMLCPGLLEGLGPGGQQRLEKLSTSFGSKAGQGGQRSGHRSLRTRSQHCCQHRLHRQAPKAAPQYNWEQPLNGGHKAPVCARMYKSDPAQSVGSCHSQPLTFTNFGNSDIFSAKQRVLQRMTVYPGLFEAIAKLRNSNSDCTYGNSGCVYPVLNRWEGILVEQWCTML
jgi:hypothetical protein